MNNMNIVSYGLKLKTIKRKYVREYWDWVLLIQEGCCSCLIKEELPGEVLDHIKTVEIVGLGSQTTNTF